MSVDDTIKALEARDEQLSEEIQRLSLQPDETTGNAIIVFDWVHNAANMLHDHNFRNRWALSLIACRSMIHLHAPSRVYMHALEASTADLCVV